MQRALDFVANEIGVRQHYAAIDLAQPVGADEGEHDFGIVDTVGKPLRKEVTGIDVFNIEEQLVSIEPERQAVMQPPRVATRV